MPVREAGTSLHPPTASLAQVLDELQPAERIAFVETVRRIADGIVGQPGTSGQDAELRDKVEEIRAVIEHAE